MYEQSNTLFLSYSQDAVNRLPQTIAHALDIVGFNVFMDKNHFQRFAEPPERIKNEIRSRAYFLLLVTPASIRYGFRGSEKRLSTELKIAKESQKHIVILLGYGKTQYGGWSRFTSRLLPDNPIFCEISIENFALSIQQLVSHFQRDITLLIESLESLTTYTQKELNAEYGLDEALTEQYESVLYNRISSSLEMINQAIEIDPNFADLYYFRAFFRRGHKDRPKLLEDYTKAIELDPTNARFYVSRGSIYRRLQRHDEALEDYTTSIKLAPDFADFYYRRAGIRQHLNLFELALEDYSKAIQLSPKDWNTWRSRGVLYSIQQDYNLALADINQVIKLKQYWRDYVLRGFLYSELNMTDEAQKDWETAVKLADDLEFAHILRAGHYHYKGKSEIALQILDEFIETHLDNKRAVKFRNSILAEIGK